VITKTLQDNAHFTPGQKLLLNSPEPNKANQQDIMLASFTIKEAIESAPMIKYFLEEILHLPSIELPELLNNNYLWIGMHCVVCNIGMYSMLGRVDPVSPLMLSSSYANRILTYEYLFEQRQERLQNTEDKSINNPLEFIEKCGPDIVSQVALVVMNNGLYIAPTIYDVTISVTVGGMQCYQQYKQAGNPIPTKEQSITQVIAPYVADTVVAASTVYALHKNNPLDTASMFGQLMAIKQGFVVMSSVVMTDYITKLSVATYEELYPENITNIAGDIYDYFTKGETYSEL